MRLNNHIPAMLVFFIVTYFCSCKARGYIVTAKGEYLYGKISFPDGSYDIPSDMGSDKYNTLKIKSKSGKKIYSIPARKIRYVKVKWWGVKDSTVYKALKLNYGTVLCVLVKSEKNASIYSRTSITYTNSPEYGNSVMGKDYILVSNGDIIEMTGHTPFRYSSSGLTRRQHKKEYNEWLSKQPVMFKKIMTSFINQRYNQHFQPKDLKIKDSVFNYILNKENERIDSSNKPFH